MARADLSIAAGSALGLSSPQSGLAPNLAQGGCGKMFSEVPGGCET